MAKVVSKSSPKFVTAGPSGGMSSKNSVGPQKAGVSSQEGNSSAKFASGGKSGGMAKHSGAGTIVPGTTGNPMNGSTGGWAKGGGSSGGYRQSQAAQPGKTSAS